MRWYVKRFIHHSLQWNFHVIYLLAYSKPVVFFYLSRRKKIVEELFKTSGILEDYSCSVLCMFWLSYPVTMLKHADCVHNRCLCCEYSRFSLICNVLFHFFCKLSDWSSFPNPFSRDWLYLKANKKAFILLLYKCLAFFLWWESFLPQK